MTITIMITIVSNSKIIIPIVIPAITPTLNTRK